MKRTREKIWAAQREREPVDHLGREVRSFKDITLEVLEAVRGEQKTTKKEEDK